MFSDAIIIAEIHNDDGDSNNTLSLKAPKVELDVFDITDTPSTNSHVTRYTHPLDLIVHNTISARIEPGTELSFTAVNPSIKNDFTVAVILGSGLFSRINSGSVASVIFGDIVSTNTLVWGCQVAFCYVFGSPLASITLILNVA